MLTKDLAVYVSRWHHYSKHFIFNNFALNLWPGGLSCRCYSVFWKQACHLCQACITMFQKNKVNKCEGKFVNVTITQSSSTSFFLVDSMRWWPVIQSVPSTGFWNGPCITTPSSLGIGINSANSMAGFNPNWSVALAPENKQKSQVFQWECQVRRNCYGNRTVARMYAVSRPAFIKKHFEDMQPTHQSLI